MKPEYLEVLQARLRYMLYAERVTRILCRRSGEVPGFRWRAPPASCRDQARLSSHRSPPLPFHSFVHSGGGTCRVCGQPIYGGGSFRSFAGPRSKWLTWHTLCTSTYFLMRKPADCAAMLILRQGGLCSITGEPLGPPAKEWIGRGVDVDHEVPLFRVARERSEEPWFELIRFWGFGNLRAITNSAHVAKNAAEARERAGYPKPIVGQEAML